MVAAFFGLANLALIAPFYLAGPPPAAGQTYRALLLNVLEGNPSHEQVEAFISSVDADFIVLVEISDEWQPMLGSLEADYPYSSYVLSRAYNDTVLYSRIPFHGAGFRRVGAEERPAVSAQFNLEGQSLTVIGAHPQSPGLPSRTARRNRQLMELAHFISGQAGAVLLLGDLNTTPWSPVFHDFIQDSGLQNGRYGFGLHPSWPTQAPLLRIPLDHALVSPQVKVQNFETGPYVGSDHYPVIVDFSLQPTEAYAH